MAVKNKYTQAIWSATSKTWQPRPKLQKDIEADVAIVGGGITGIAAAYFLQQSGKKVAVLEQRKVGYGTTGSSTGNLYVPSGKFHKIRHKHGKQGLLDVIAARKEAMEFIETTISRHNIDCGFTKVPWCYFSSEAGQAAEKVEQELEALKTGEIDVFTDAPENFPFPVAAMARVEMQAQFDPLQYVQQLAEAVEGENCTIFENTKVNSISDGDPCILETEGGTVKAKKVIQATHTPKGVYAVHAEMETYREHAVAAKLKNDVPAGAIYWRQGKENMYSVRTWSGETGSWLIVLDDSHLTGHKEHTEKSYEKVEKFLRRYFDVEKVEYLWAAQNYKPADDIPYIGTSPLQNNVYIATGFAADGLVWGVAAARIISDLITGAENKLATVFNPKRFTPSASFQRFKSENVHVAKHLLKDYLLKSGEKELHEVKSGEGKIVKIDGEKYAVYKNEGGAASIVSAICPHMGCVVHWNSAERSWDCPCHGSRFSTDGEVLEGPAFNGLPKLSDK